MLTQTDLKQIKNLITESLADFYQNLLLPHFATKEDLKGFATKDDLKDLKEEMSRKFVTKDEYLTGQDEIMGELKTIREELAFTHHRVYDKHQPQLEDHELRITNLETA